MNELSEAETGKLVKKNFFIKSKNKINFMFKFNDLDQKLLQSQIFCFFFESFSFEVQNSAQIYRIIHNHGLWLNAVCLTCRSITFLIKTFLIVIIKI